MTTNVFDQLGGMLATDSRWSLNVEDFAAIYVDDAPFEKIASDGRLAYMFAGDSDKIRLWKDWINDPNRVVLNIPKITGPGLALCIIDIDTKKVVFAHNQEITDFDSDSRFAGSGAYSAHHCWSKNRCAKKAVETAKLADRYSGGTVKFLDLATRSNNLSSPDDYDSIRSDLLQRGMVMYFASPPHQTLTEAAKNDPRIADAATKIARGELPMAAPSAAAQNEWSPEDVERLQHVLEQYHPKK